MRLIAVVEKLLLSAEDHDRRSTAPKLKLSGGRRLSGEPLQRLLKRARAADANLYGPGLVATVEMIVSRLRRWTLYNLQEGRVAYSTKWEYKWRILSRWEKWERADASWIERLEEAIPDFHAPKTNVPAEEDRLRKTCERLKLHRKDS